jgi:hypothetical protein
VKICQSEDLLQISSRLYGALALILWPHALVKGCRQPPPPDATPEPETKLRASGLKV